MGGRNQWNTHTPSGINSDSRFISTQSRAAKKVAGTFSMINKPGELASLEQGLKTRPWVRFWARNIDLSIAVFFFGLLWEILGPPFNTKWVFYGMLYAFLWVPVEAFFLATLGTTPGKWLLKTTLRDSKGNKLKFSDGLSRSLYVWTWGLGIGFWYATLVGALFGYLDLKNKGTTRWDREGGFQVSHGKIGGFRLILAIILLGCFFLALVLLNDFVSEAVSIASTPMRLIGLGILLIIGSVIFLSLWLEDQE